MGMRPPYYPYQKWRARRRQVEELWTLSEMYWITSLKPRPESLHFVFFYNAARNHILWWSQQLSGIMWCSTQSGRSREVSILVDSLKEITLSFWIKSAKNFSGLNQKVALVLWACHSSQCTQLFLMHTKPSPNAPRWFYLLSTKGRTGITSTLLLRMQRRRCLSGQDGQVNWCLREVNSQLN